MDTPPTGESSPEPQTAPPAEAPTPAALADFGEAEYILTAHRNLSMLVCPSRTVPEHFHLFRKNKAKRLTNDSFVTYFECNQCKKLGSNEKGRVTVRDDRLISDPDIGHNPVCFPIDRATLEATRLKREILKAAEHGVKPARAYQAGLAEIAHRFQDDQNLQQQVESIMPPYKSMRTSLFNRTSASQPPGERSSTATNHRIKCGGTPTRNPHKALLLLGSVRDGRMVDRVSKFVRKKLQDAKFTVDLIDPQELKLPMLEKPLHFYTDPSQSPPQILIELNEKIKSADCFIIVTAEYNRQMPPALTNLIDHFPPRSYSFKSSAIVTYSLGSGGQVAAAQARTLMVELGAPPIPFVFHLPEVAKKLDEYGQVSMYMDDSNSNIHHQMEKMITQLTWYTSAMRNHRKLAGEPEWGPSVSV